MSPPRKANSTMCVIQTEGIEYAFDWAKFPIGGHVFVPCLATNDVLATIQRSARANHIKISYQIGERNELWGVGIWRMC